MAGAQLGRLRGQSQLLKKPAAGAFRAVLKKILTDFEPFEAAFALSRVWRAWGVYPPYPLGY